MKRHGFNCCLIITRTLFTEGSCLQLNKLGAFLVLGSVKTLSSNLVFVPMLNRNLF